MSPWIPPTKPKPQPKGPTELVPAKPQKRNPLVPDSILLPRPVTDQFMEDVQRRAAYRAPDRLELPKDPKEPVTVPNVPLPGPDAKPSPTEAYVQSAAQQLGFSPQVSAIATTELSRRLGNDLVIDLKTKKQLVSYEDLKATGDGTTAPYTFDANAVAVLKDANTAASLGMNSLQELYAQQASTTLPRLKEAAINGTDLDLDKELASINDPAVKDAMSAYYEAMRTTRDLGHGDDAAFERLPFAKRDLEKAMQALPRNGPFNAQLQALDDEMQTAQETLLAGTEQGGNTPRAAIALMNNIAGAPLGKLPDESIVLGATTNIEQQALAKGATPQQASALRDAMEMAYQLKANGGSSQERLDQNRAKLDDLVKQAGPFARPLRGVFDEVGKQARVNGAQTQTQPLDPKDAEGQAEQIAGLAEKLKLAAKSADVKGLPEALEALQSAAESIKNGNTAEGVLAGVKAAPAIVSGLLELMKKLPNQDEAARELLGKVGAVFKGPFDVVGMYANGKKVITGTDLDGKPISQADRANAAAELVFSDAPSVLGTVAELAGATTVTDLLAAAAPPAAIALGQAKLMIWTMEQAGKMKSNIAQHELRERFHLGDGDDAQFSRAFQGQLDQIANAPTTRSDQAYSTMRSLVNDQFQDSDTRARFLAYASNRMPGGRQTILALVRGDRIPALADLNAPPGTSRKEGAQTIEAANQLKKLAQQFYQLEMGDVRHMLDRTTGLRRGESYMTSPADRAELSRWFPNR